MKKVTLIFGGNPDIYKEELEAFDISFQELGYKTTILNLGKKYDNNISFGDFNVVVDAYCRLSPKPGAYNIILHEENNSRSDYNSWSKVLHLSPLKICKNSIYFPLGYSKSFDWQFDVSDYQEDIPISFFGKITEKRGQLLWGMKGGKYDITLIKPWGELRSKTIARTKINMTMKSVPNCIFESVRANLILSKGKLLFAEENYNGGYGYMEPYLIPFNTKNFDALVDHWIDDKKRHEFCEYVKNEMITKHSFTRYVKEIILEK
jgi:hypothetical protein